jgi:hypothetical protein
MTFGRKNREMSKNAKSAFSFHAIPINSYFVDEPRHPHHLSEIRWPRRLIVLTGSTKRTPIALGICCLLSQPGKKTLDHKKQNKKLQ